MLFKHKLKNKNQIHYQKKPYKTESKKQQQIKQTKTISADSSFCVKSCDGHCCREYAILITAQDARRILNAIPSLDVRKFIYFYLGGIEPGNEYAKIKINGKEYCLGMLFVPKTEACLFQTHLGLCGIHEFSPMICRAFPFTLNDENEVIYKEDIICQELIPISDPVQIKAFLIKRQNVLKEYHDLVAEWNEKNPSGSMMQFLQFAGLLR